MIIIYILTISILILLSLITLVDWSVHKSMTIDNCDTWGYTNFNTFIKEAYKYKDWERSAIFHTSLFGKGEEHDKYKIHAGIIKINGNGMVLDYISWIKFLYWNVSNGKDIKYNENLWKILK